MSDSHLRELERRFQETHSPQDEADWLRERLRVGELARIDLELASYLGHPPAVLVIGQVRPTRVRLETASTLPLFEQDPTYRALCEWVFGLKAWDANFVLEAAGCAIASKCEHEAERVACLRYVKACRRVWLDPSDENQVRLREPVEGADALSEGLSFGVSLLYLATLNHAVGYHGFMGGEGLTREACVELLVAMLLGGEAEAIRAEIREALVPTTLTL